MKLPLYRQAQESFNKLNKDKGDLNLGLYYQKFCDQWNNNRNLELDKQGFLSDITEKSDRVDRKLLDEQIARMYNLTCTLGGKFKIYELTEQFITGVGLDHPIEVGFLWNHTLGIPYIAGSSIKGIVKNWADNWSQEDNIKSIFGSNLDDVKENQVGSVIFFDALPYGRINLKTDIMTPHYTSYYSNNKCPGDWSNPIPIPFLTVDKNQRFIFFVAPRTKNDIKDCSKVIEWLDEALTTLGAGAKTATGYGCFKPVEDAEKSYNEQLKLKIKEEKRKRELENMSSIRRLMEEDGYSTDSDLFMRNLYCKMVKTS